MSVVQIKDVEDSDKIKFLQEDLHYNLPRLRYSVSYKRVKMFQTKYLSVSSKNLSKKSFFPYIEFSHTFLENSSMYDFLKRMNKIYFNFIKCKFNIEAEEDIIEYHSSIKVNIPLKSNGELDVLIFDKNKNKIDLKYPYQLDEFLIKGSVVKAIINFPDLVFDPNVPLKFNITKLRFNLKQLLVIVSKNDILKLIYKLNSDKKSYFYKLTSDIIEEIIYHLNQESVESNTRQVYPEDIFEVDSDTDDDNTLSDDDNTDTDDDNTDDNTDTDDDDDGDDNTDTDDEPDSPLLSANKTLQGLHRQFTFN